MVRVGLTGGIGSGKSTVASFFQENGISVYIADVEAKRLMVEDTALKAQIIDLLGPKAYTNNTLNRDFIAKQVFRDPIKLSSLNGIVHPAVRSDFENWCTKQTSEYVIKEAAVLFENEGYAHCDFTILVRAPKETRLQRVQKRDNTSRDQIESRMSAQWADFRKAALSDCIIDNVSLEQTQQEVERIHKHLLRRIKAGWYPIK